MHLPIIIVNGPKILIRNSGSSLKLIVSLLPIPSPDYKSIAAHHHSRAQ